MAKTGANSVAGEARNHTFDFISPTATIKNGNPNSCNLCHKDQTSEWSLSFVKKWFPKLEAGIPKVETIKTARAVNQ